MAAFGAIQELICLKGVLMIEIGINLVDPITFMDDMVADVMTKVLPFDLHSKHAKNITGNGNVK